jgi:hypothetical protein
MDLDQTLGKMDILLRYETTYKLCATYAPFSYMWVPNQTLCVTKTITMGTADIDLGGFNVIKQYSGSWKVEDGFGWGLIGPSTFHVSLPGGGQADVVDNDPTIDEDPTLGSIRVTYPFGGSYTVCETVPPAGYWNANPACKQFTVTAGVPADLGSFVNYQKQVFRP